MPIFNKGVFLPYSGDYYLDLYRESLKATNSPHNGNKELRFFSTFQLAEYAAQQGNGHFVECGCFKGQSTYAISKILRKYNFAGKFLVFDSFGGGLSAFTDKDLVTSKQRPNKLSKEEQTIRTDRFKNARRDVELALSEFDFVELHEGWIPEKFPVADTVSFQFVHIDVDLYEPTLDSLKFFFPRLNTGGVLVCDDYNFEEWPGAKAAWDEYFSDKELSFQYEVPVGSKFLIK